MTAVVTVNRLGHLPGDAVIVDARIENHSPLLVEALQVALVMTSIFRCRKKVSRSSQVCVCVCVFRSYKPLVASAIIEHLIYKYYELHKVNPLNSQ